MKHILLAIALFLSASGSLLATHNRAGEITYEQITQFYYKVTITTYTKTSSPADRPTLDIFWGDGTGSTLPRASFQDNFGGAGSDIRKNLYYGFHTYPGPSVYKLYFEDPNRNGGVVNIPNSINVPFYVESQLIISAFLGFNNSPVLLQPPIDDGTLNQVFIHNANAFDPDGDSLSYHLIYCKGADGLPIPGYTYPTANNSFTLDEITGDLVWDTPQSCGEFNVAFLIKEWRNGVTIGYVERDMQINILCNNQNNNEPPQIANIADICVTAGQTVNFTVTATDPNATNLVTLTATGSPLSLNAQFNQPVSGTGTISEPFTWVTACEHVRRQPYTMVFKAEDNDPYVNLVDLENVRITVVAPAPQNPASVPVGNAIQLTWDQSICPEAVGYKIYRRAGFYGFVPGPCETGVPSYTGYSLITTVTGLGTTAFLDNNNNAGLVPGTDYCYMIVAYFPDGAESYASVEVCTTLKKDLPVITNVSVTDTDPSAGIIDVAWSAPTDLDLLQFPAPHEYHVLRAEGINGTNFVQAGITFSLQDTFFTDNNLNTTDLAYTYKIELYATVNGTLQLVGESQKASSVFLSISPTDEKLNLNWNLNVPWQNQLYTVYRFNGAAYDSIGFSNSTSFTDSGLVNGQQYCYYIRSTGSYQSPGFVDPIINLSQEACAIPVDNIPPCAVNTSSTDFNCIEKQLTLNWNIPDSSCADDIASYNIYYTSTPGGTFSLLDSILTAGVHSYTYSNENSIAGCYYVTAVDSTGNEGAPGDSVCFDNCPFYELPNVFTPDGNNLNDTFHPFPYRYIKDINITIYSRWGLEVFHSTEPDINWNGKTDNSGEELPEGVYYYTCIVNEIYLAGIKSRQLKGTIQLIRSNQTKSE
jgi:gliding motility-associated-like protein